MVNCYVSYSFKVLVRASQDVTGKAGGVSEGFSFYSPFTSQSVLFYKANFT